jgi:hypothetical protein
MFPLIFILFVALVVGGLLYQWHRDRARREAWLLSATKLGLNYSREDPFRLDTLPFGLFRQGRGRGVENVVWGPWQALDVKVFDYWYYTESTDSKGNTSRRYHRFTCGCTPVPASWPHLSVARETILTRLGDFAGFRDIQFESDEFNRCFQVKSGDERFASYVIDPRMMEWLLEAGPGWTFEVHGGWLLVHTGKVRDSDFTNHLRAMGGFLRTVPDVVRDVYGTL